MSSEMNKSPMEIKCEELWEQRKETLLGVQYKSDRENFQAGFKAALELPEIKQLVEALESIADNRRTVPAFGLIMDAEEALKAWKSFKGE